MYRPRQKKTDKLRLMKKPHERLRWARQRAGHDSAESFAKANGLVLPTYRSHENGTRNFKRSTAQLYGELLRVSPIWLFTGEGVPTMGAGDSENINLHYIPIVAWEKIPDIMASGGIGMTHADDVLEIQRPHDRVFALTLPSGWYVILDANDRAPEDGENYAFRIGDRTLIRKYRDTSGPLRLEPASRPELPANVFDAGAETIFPDNGLVIVGRVTGVHIWF